jgi:hypothetical protein
MVHAGSYDLSYYARASHTVPGMFKEAVGLFINVQDLQNAIRTLEGSAFPRQDISVMAGREKLDEVFGDKVVDPLMAMDNADTPRQAPSRPEEQTIGTAALIGGGVYVGAMAMALAAGAMAFPALISAAVIGGVGGGSVGAVLSKVLGDRYADHLEEQIEKGGLLLWVRTSDEQKEQLATTILRQHNGKFIHIHEMV